MGKGVSTHLIVFLAIVAVGGGILLGEYLLVKWWPVHQQHVADSVLALLHYQNDGLGIEMQVAAGIYGKIEGFPGGVRIYRPTLFGTPPSLTITSQSNPGSAAEFSPEILAKWQTEGVTEDTRIMAGGPTSPAMLALIQANVPQYSFEHVRMNDRDAALISQYRNKVTTMTAHVISPAHIIEASCTPGSADLSLYLPACDRSLRTIKVAGPPSPMPMPQGQGVQEVQYPPAGSGAKH